MTAASDLVENTVLSVLFNSGSFTAPTNYYVALFTSSTGLETNSPTSEVSTSGTAYARETITFTTAAAGSVSNDGQILFDAATATWGTVTHLAIVDHASNTNWGTDVNVYFWSPVSASKEILTGDTILIADGNLTITLD